MEFFGRRLTSKLRDGFALVIPQYRSVIRKDVFVDRGLGPLMQFKSLRVGLEVSSLDVRQRQAAFNDLICQFTVIEESH
jgi:hypothetical protein